ncbi:MAG: hypothetical protein AB7G76_00135 [Steroidobacteraceae bacterium]
MIRRRIGSTRLRAEVARRLPFDAEVMICQGREVIALVRRNPFAAEPSGPDAVRFVSVLSRRPRRSPHLPLHLPSRDNWLVKILEGNRRFVVGLYRRRMKVLAHLGKLDDLFGVPLTTRNWNTITAIAAVLEDAPSS